MCNLSDLICIAKHSPQYRYEQYIGKIFHHIIFGKDSSRFSSGMLKVNISSFMRHTNSWHVQKHSSFAEAWCHVTCCVRLIKILLGSCILRTLQPFLFIQATKSYMFFITSRCNSSNRSRACQMLKDTCGFQKKDLWKGWEFNVDGSSPRRVLFWAKNRLSQSCLAQTVIYLEYGTYRDDDWKFQHRIALLWTIWLVSIPLVCESYMKVIFVKYRCPRQRKTKSPQHTK